VIQPSDEPDSLSAMRRPNVISTHHERPAGVACRFHVREHFVSRESSDARHVLSNDETGSQLSDESGEVRPEVTLVSLGLLLPGDAEGLAGEPADDGVDSSQRLNCEAANVVMDGHLGPVLPQHLAAEGVNLAEGHRLESARALQPEADAPDAGEQVQRAKPHARSSVYT
jgi:hypothetical protein